MFVLFLFTLYGIVSALDAAMTSKYEVDEAYVAIELNKSLSDHQKIIKYEEVSEMEQQLKNTLATYTGMSVVSFIGILILLYNRSKFR